MMGNQGAAQERLFYSFSLEDHVPRDQLLRGIDRFLDLGDLRQHLAPFYSHTGRPSIGAGTQLHQVCEYRDTRQLARAGALPAPQ